MHRRPSKPSLRRPPRDEVLSPDVVAPFLDVLAERQRRLVTVLYIGRLLAGLLIMTWCVSDILAAGPARPVTVPVVGLYMALTVGAFAAGGSRAGSVVWMFAVLDVGFLTSLYFLAQPVVLADPQISLALLLTILLFVYSLAARVRLSGALLAAGAIAMLVAGIDGPDLFSAPAISAANTSMKASLLVMEVALAGVLAYWTANYRSRKLIGRTLSGLDRMEDRVLDLRVNGRSL
jgi:hypothetical protein